MPFKFICDLFKPAEADIIVFGAPFGKNSKEVLTSLRKVSDFVETFDLDKKRNIFDDIKTADIGDLKLKKLDEITKKCEEILKLEKIPLMLARGHLASLFSLKAFSEDVKVIVFDAHADLKNRYEHSMMTSYYKSIIRNDSLFKFNGATWLRRFCESRKNDVVLLGVRSCDEFEFEYMKKRNILFFTPTQIRKNMNDVKEKLNSFLSDSKFYVSFDIDAFDPSIAPAVEYLEPNGLFFHEFVDLIEPFKGGKLVGLDLNCQKYLPNNQTTDFLATKTIIEILSYFQKSK